MKKGNLTEDICSNPPKLYNRDYNNRKLYHPVIDLDPKQKGDFQAIGQSTRDSEGNDSDESSTAKLNFVGSINGILKGGKLKKGDGTQVH